jgi:acyl-CoA synthetase (AMP-forming)/AMP-acid ligase II
MNRTDIAGISRALRADMRLKTIYEIICNYGDTEAAVWLENGKQKTRTFSEYARLTRNFAAALRGMVGADPGAYVGLSMDTCKEWIPTFWGIIQAGYNVILLDMSLSDEMISYLLAQAGAKALVTTKPRVLAAGVKYVDARALADAPEAPADFAPEYGDQVALCTSGTTGTSRVFVYHGRAIVEQVLSSELLHNACPRMLAAEHRRALAFLPFHHVFGFMANVMWVPFLGYANIYLENRTRR